MNKIIKASIACFMAMCANVLFAQTAELCHHDAAPVDTTRYSKDLAAGNIVDKTVVAKGTSVKMAYKPKELKGQKAWLTCTTAKTRMVVKTLSGEQYDAGCGNDVEGTFFTENKTSVESIPTPPITNSCGAACMIAKHNADHMAACMTPMVFVPATVENLASKCMIKIDHVNVTSLNTHTQLNVTATDGATFTDKRTNPTTTIPKGKMEVVDNGTQIDQKKNCPNCTDQPAVNLLDRTPASYCGIITTDGKRFKIGHDRRGFVTMTQFEGGKEVGYYLTFNGVTSNDCPKVLSYIEEKHWPKVTSHFGLQNGCSVAQKDTPKNNKVSNKD